VTKNRAASRLVVSAFSEQKVIAAAKEARAELGADVSVAIVFATSDYLAHLEDFLELVRVYGRAPLLIGSTGAGLIGTNLEAEDKPGFSLLLLSLPQTRVTAFEFTQGQLEASTGPAFWHGESGLGAEDVDTWIVLANPFRLSVDRWLGEWNAAYPGVPSIGGLASGGTPRGKGGQTGNNDGDDGAEAESGPAEEIVLFRDGHASRGDALALALSGGGVRVQTIVSQGCRPIGEPLTVTGAKGNHLLTLGSRPAYEVLNTVFQGLSEKEKARAQGNLFAGLAMSEYLEEYKRGDFLIRNILGADPKTGAVAISSHLRVGQTLQYQLRDRDSADEDLRELCHAAREQIGDRAFASLLFPCTGRGRGLFRAPDHDAGVLGEVFGPLPGTGFFCNGEIGPVGAHNYVHGYTASIALLSEP